MILVLGDGALDLERPASIFSFTLSPTGGGPNGYPPRGAGTLSGRWVAEVDLFEVAGWAALDSGAWAHKGALEPRRNSVASELLQKRAGAPGQGESESGLQDSTFAPPRCPLPAALWNWARAKTGGASLLRPEEAEGVRLANGRFGEEVVLYYEPWSSETEWPVSPTPGNAAQGFFSVSFCVGLKARALTAFSPVSLEVLSFLLKEWLPRVPEDFGSRGPNDRRSGKRARGAPRGIGRRRIIL